MLAHGGGGGGELRPGIRLGRGLVEALARAGIPTTSDEDVDPADASGAGELWLDSVARFVGRLLDYPEGGLLVVDDVHRADAESRRVLQRLAAGAAMTRRLIVVTAREADSNSPRHSSRT